MGNKISKAGIIGILGGLSVALILSGCPGHRYLQKAAKTATFTIEEAEYEGAFSKAMKTAAEIDFHVSNYDKGAGIIHARRGAGFTEVTEMDIFLEREAPGRLTLVLKIKTSKNHQEFIKEFVDAYGKYVKIVPRS